MSANEKNNLWDTGPKGEPITITLLNRYGTKLTLNGLLFYL